MSAAGRAVLLLLLASGGCATAIQPDARRGGYAIFASRGRLTLLVLPGSRGRRFQGTIHAPKGRLLGTIVSRADLRERVALDGEVLQFDLEPSPGVADGFDFAVTGACARLELLIDGRPTETGIARAGVRIDRRGGALLVCARGELR